MWLDWRVEINVEGRGGVKKFRGMGGKGRDVGKKRWVERSGEIGGVVGWTVRVGASGGVVEDERAGRTDWERSRDGREGGGR